MIIMERNKTLSKCKIYGIVRLVSFKTKNLSHLCSLHVIFFLNHPSFKAKNSCVPNWVHKRCIFTGRNEVVAKVMFLQVSVIHSVHRGGSPENSPLAGRTPPPHLVGRTPPWQGEPPPAGRTPPPEADSSIRSTSGRYASYWNAFLLHLCFDFLWGFQGQ